MNEPSISVLCVDDHTVLVDGMRARLELEHDIKCVGSLSKADMLVPEAERTGANVVLLDIEMPGTDPFEAIEDLRRTCPNARVIMLSAHVRDHYVDAAVKAGAWGYFYKGDDPDAIVEGIRRVAKGQFTLGPKVEQRCGLGGSGGAAREDRIVETKLSALTPREMQVLRMIGRGMSRRQIAETLHRSPKTIDCHRASIMQKLEIGDRVELARYAIREGLAEA